MVEKETWYLYKFHIQGGILSDGICASLSFFTVAPLLIFTQNNGTIIIT